MNRFEKFKEDTKIYQIIEKSEQDDIFLFPRKSCKPNCRLSTEQTPNVLTQVSRRDENSHKSQKEIKILH